MEPYAIFGLVILVWLIVAVACACMGAKIGGQHNAAVAGVVLGFVFLLPGVIVSAFWENRHRCPDCLSRVDNHAHVCRGCGATLQWNKHWERGWEIINEHLAAAEPADRSA